MSETKSWRAEMPPRHQGRVNYHELTCHEGDVEELVTRTNSELDAKDSQIAELERERDEALARAEKAESALADAHASLKQLADRARYDADVRMLALLARPSVRRDRILSAPYWKGGK